MSLLSYPISELFTIRVNYSENSQNYYFQEWILSSKLQSFMNLEKPKASLFDCMKHVICYSRHEDLYVRDEDVIIPNDDLYLLFKCEPFERLTCSKIEQCIMKHFTNLKQVLSQTFKEIKQHLEPDENIFFNSTNNDSFKVKRNIYGNWEHLETGFVFNYFSQGVYGKQVNNTVLHLTNDDIELCNNYKFKISEDSLDLFIRKTDLEKENFKNKVNNNIDSYLMKQLKTPLELAEEFNNIGREDYLTPRKISIEMAQFMNSNPEQKYSIIDVTKYVNNYIKINKLNNPDNPREFIPNLKLSSLLKYYDDKPLTYSRLQVLLKKHLFIDKYQDEKVEVEQMIEDEDKVEEHIKTIVEEIVNNAINTAIENIRTENLSETAFVESTELACMDHIIDINDVSSEDELDDICASTDEEILSEDEWTQV